MLTTPAPAPLPIASALPSALSLEEVIGEVTAAAVVALARALREFQTDGLSFGTKMRVGNLIARLFELRLCAGQIDFFDVARVHGARLLQDRYGRDVNARTIAVLIDAVIEALRHVVSRELN
jgi:hypothetical protein